VALVAAPGPFRRPFRLQPDEIFRPSPDRRNEGFRRSFAGIESAASAATGETDMNDDRNSVLEARWLLAVPASMLLTVLIAGLLLG
jgi:hypothetical protein